jgi:DNA-directed RNA polymerase specialized sigma24 family protein
VPEPDVVEPAILRALQALPVDHRSVVVCRLLLGWSEAETADALGIRPGTAKSRLHRATTTLATQLSHLRPPTNS